MKKSIYLLALVLILSTLLLACGTKETEIVPEEETKTELTEESVDKVLKIGSLFLMDRSILWQRYVKFISISN